MAVVRAALRGTEHAHPSAQAFRERGGAQRAHPRRGELQRERQAVEPAADLRDRSRVLLGEDEAGIRGRGTIDEQLHGFRARDRLHRLRIALGQCKGANRPRALAGEPERLATRREHGDVGARAAHPVDERCERLDQVLAVVEHDEHLAVTEELDERRLERQMLALLHFERRRHRLDRGTLVARRGELDHTGRSGPACRRGGGEPEREPGLAHAPGPDQRHETLALEQSPDRGEVVVAADESRRVEVRHPARAARRSVRRLLRGLGEERRIVGDDPVLELTRDG